MKKPSGKNQPCAAGPPVDANEEGGNTNRDKSKVSEADEDIGQSEAEGIWESAAYDPLPSQQAFHDAAAPFKGFSGPVGSGKSAALCYEVVRQAIKNAGCTGVVAAPTFRMLRDTTETMLFSMLEQEGVQYSIRRSNGLVYLPESSSTILLRSLDRPERLRGTNLAWFGLDELSYVREESWLRLIARLRDPAAKQLCGFGVWTPKGDDWVHRRFIAERASGYLCVRASPFENRFLLENAPDYYEQLRGSYDEKFFRQEVLGEYLNVQVDRVYYAFNRADHVGTYKYDPNLPLLWSLDFNVNPMSSVIAQNRSDSVVVIDEISLKMATTDQAAQEFANRYRNHQAGLIVMGDASGNQRKTTSGSDFELLMRTLLQEGIRVARKSVPTKNPPVLWRVRKVNSALRSATGDVTLRMDARCKALIRDMEQVTYKANSALIDKERDALLTHMSDALGYLIWELRGEKTQFGEIQRRLLV